MPWAGSSHLLFCAELHYLFWARIGYRDIDHLCGALGVMSTGSLTWRREFPLGCVFLVVLACWQFLFLASFNPYNNFVRFSHPLVISELSTSTQVNVFVWMFVEHLLCAGQCSKKLRTCGFFLSIYNCVLLSFYMTFTSFHCCSNTVRLLLSPPFLRRGNRGWVNLPSWIYLTSQSESFVSCARVHWLSGPELAGLDWILALPFAAVVWGKLFNFSWPRFPHL